MPIVSYGYGKGGDGSGGITKIVESLAISIELNVTGGNPGVAKDACGREVKNWCFTRGDNPPIVVTLTDANSADPDNPDPIDMTGATSKLTVHTTPTPTDATTQVFELTGVTQSPATGGVIHFSPTKANANQSPGVYFYDIQVEFPDGTRRTVGIGEWEYDPGDLSDPGAS